MIYNLWNSQRAVSIKVRLQLQHWAILDEKHLSSLRVSQEVNYSNECVMTKTVLFLAEKKKRKKNLIFYWILKSDVHWFLKSAKTYVTLG